MDYKMDTFEGNLEKMQKLVMISYTQLFVRTVCAMLVMLLYGLRVAGLIDFNIYLNLFENYPYNEPLKFIHTKPT